MKIKKVETTNFDKLVKIYTQDYKDNRGLFYESFNCKAFKEIGITENFVQDNISVSQKNVLRGLHFQLNNPQAKLVSVIQGRALDIAVDLRPHSATFGKHHKTYLNDEKKAFVYIPKGFAHGFLSLSNNTIFSYKCSQFYYPDDQHGIIYNDDILNINWNNQNNFVLSKKDKNLPSFSYVKKLLYAW